MTGARTSGRSRRGSSLERVLLVHPSPDLYGSDRVLLESVSAFAAQMTDVVVILPGEGELADEIRARGGRVEICPMPVLRKSATRPAGLIRLVADFVGSVIPSRRLFRRIRPDLVYVNTVTIPSWLLLSRIWGVPSLCHVHEAEGSQPRLLLRALYAPLLLADALVVNSQYSLDILGRAWTQLAGRAQIIYNGVPGPPAVKPPRSSPDPVRLLFIGRLSPRKGPQIALEAFQRLRDRHHAAELSLLGAVFPGYEWFEDELRTAAAAHEESVADVRFLGFQQDIWPVLAEHDIVLVPSTVDEPFGNTAVEAMLGGRPLVVSDTSGLREAADDFSTARFVPAGDSAAVADAVEALLGDWAAAREAGAADRDAAEQRFAPRRYQSDILTAARAVRRVWAQQR